MGNSNSVGANIGDAASGIGSGFASYELAKNDPKLYYKVTVINAWILGILLVFFLIVFIVAMIKGKRDKGGKAGNKDNKKSAQ